jgi:hypothetical protein
VGELDVGVRVLAATRQREDVIDVEVIGIHGGPTELADAAIPF